MTQIPADNARFRHMARASAVTALVAFSTACSGSGSGQINTGSASGSLAGTWDVAGTDMHGSTSRATLTMTDSLIQIQHQSQIVRVEKDGGHFVASTNGGYAETPTTNLVPLSGPSMNVGALPFNFTGQWVAAGPDSPPSRGCSWTWGNRLDARCGDVVIPAYLMPLWFSNPDNDQFGAFRLDSRPSIFGDLGGTWQIESTTTAPCTIKIENSNINGECGDSGERSTFQIEASDGFISGWTSTGVEFTAKRR